ncbi:polyphenol oxidase family protein [Desulfoplanes formicivorans]|uniref:Multicopper polyphenol oxidase n=1 Tax=Desulfoplanes formicivorans TaxID=1592317 RepID=A0A194AGJ6_9BACT|nr:polyphenol oxidase family protein [Desulfoplanes formicivorans]GAU08206.1 multicopper polyphenol oxidase [Desulfoplanes formicivorans]
MIPYIPFTFPHLPFIRCAFGTRMQGASTGPFAESNISFEVGDKQERVLANRHRLRRELGFTRWCELRQVHGCDMVIDPLDDVIQGTEQPGDGLATREPRVGLVIKTADCQPILLAHTSGKYIAAIHCGWKGNRQNFPCKAVVAFCNAYGLEPREILAVRGPSLSPAASEFTKFSTEWGQAFSRYFDPATQTMNLWQLTRHQLLEAGLLPSNIFGLDLCTHSMSQWFFSYRRNKVCGRQASIIWMEK